MQVKTAISLFVIVVVVALATAAFAQEFGPFPVSTTIFVNMNNTSGMEDGSPTSPFATIQEGIDAATSGDVVGVAAGTYVESVTLKSGIDMIGVDQVTTILDGGDDEGDVVQLISVTEVRVSGFTIRGAISGGVLPGGAGVFVNFPDSTIQIDNNILTGNDVGIGIFNAFLGSGGPTVDRNLIIQNNFQGIFGPGAGPVTNNVIADNGGSGIRKSGNSVASAIINNTIINNGGNGISFFDDFVSIITNNIIADNGNFGIDVSSQNNASAKRPQASFNLFFNNSSGNFSDIDPPVGSNTTLNTETEINSIPENSDNIVADPQLVDPIAGDFDLLNGSPAIDTGTNTDAPETDFAGNPRPIDGNGDGTDTTDIGAIEFQPAIEEFLVVTNSVDGLA